MHGVGDSDWCGDVYMLVVADLLLFLEKDVS